MFEGTLNKNFSCSFLYDPSIIIRFPKYKVLLVYLEIASRYEKQHVINIFGCSILLRSDLDRVVLFYALEDSKKTKTNLGCSKILNNYFIYIFKDNEEECKLRFDEKKYIFEVI